MTYASVFPLVTARALARPFTYAVPEGTSVGAVVEARFGRQRLRGIVAELGVEAPPGIEVSEVERVLETLPGPLVELALWLAGYYGSTPARAALESRLTAVTTVFPSTSSTLMPELTPCCFL